MSVFFLAPIPEKAKQIEMYSYWIMRIAIYGGIIPILFLDVGVIISVLIIYSFDEHEMQSCSS